MIYLPPPHITDIAKLPCETIMFQKSHKFKNTVLRNVVLKVILHIYLLNFYFFVKLVFQ